MSFDITITLVRPAKTTQFFGDMLVANPKHAAADASTRLNAARKAARCVTTSSLSADALTQTIRLAYPSKEVHDAFNAANAADIATMDSARETYNGANSITRTVA